MRIDPKAPANSRHHPRNAAFAGLQEQLNVLARRAAAVAAIELPSTPMVELTAAGQEIEQAIGVEAANSFPEPADAKPANVTAELEKALAAADLVGPTAKRPAKKPASGAAAQGKQPAKSRAPRKPKPGLAEALAKLDAK